MDKKLYFCSFCGKSSQEVKKMVGREFCYICESCAAYCNNLFKTANDKQQQEIKNKMYVAAGELSKKVSSRIFESFYEVSEEFGRIDQTINTVIKVLNKSKRNLNKPETLEKAKEKIEIAIDMLANL